jgi:rhomboid protease GluP
VSSPQSDESRWELLPTGCFIALVPGGLRLGLRRRGLETSFVPFAELTHVEATGFGVWIATRQTTLVVRRSDFIHPRDPDELVQTVRWRLAEEPGGEAQLERMRAVADRALHPSPRRATYALVALCLALFALEFADPFTIQVGIFVPDLVGAGEWWRVTTANLLHSVSIVPLHLIFNVLCLLAFGLLVERPLGATRTFLVMAAGGAGAMTGSGIAGNPMVLGASGVVAGLVGAVLWLEFNEPERLPAWWRIPRRLFITALIIQGLLDLVLPGIAASAHLGGLIAGFVAMPFAAKGALEREAPSPEQRVVAAVVGLVTLASLASAGQLLQRDAGALADHGRHLAALPNVGPGVLNDLAWRMVTESDPEAEDLAVATELAELAVAKTARRDPNILDTLAEVLFVAGDDEAAVAVIDEAILLAEGEVYFREQRRRFTGERAADDRPDPPTNWVRPDLEVDEMYPDAPGISI